MVEAVGAQLRSQGNDTNDKAGTQPALSFLRPAQCHSDLCHAAINEELDAVD